MPLTEGDEDELEEGEGLKLLTPNKLLTRLTNIVSTNKSWKQFIQIKKLNKINTVSFASA